jgi:DNA-nicking Smr family endonuclease
MKVRSLKELGALRDALAAAQREAAQQEVRLRLQHARAERERPQLTRAERKRLQLTRAERERLPLTRADRERHQLFAHAVGPVTPLLPHGRADLRRQPPAAHARQRELDEQAALHEAMSDEVDVESLLLTDDGLSFRRPGISVDVLTRLRRGHWAIQRQLDLHGLRREEARSAVSGFLREAHQQGLRCLRVIHGKGHGSPGREPVLRPKVHRWLAQRREVIAFAQASAPQGGAGALIVLLAPSGHRPDRESGRQPANGIVKPEDVPPLP